MRFAFVIGAVLIATSAFAKPQLPIDPLGLNNKTKSTPMSRGLDASDTKGVLNSLVSVKDQFIADVTAADTMASTIVQGSNPPIMWDPIAHMCFAGIGTPGAPDYVPGLIAFVQGLPSPAAIPMPPEGQGGLVTAAEHVRLVALAAEMAINNISVAGYPTSLRQACGSLIHEVVTAPARLGGAAMAINSLLMKYIPILAIKP